MVREDQGQRVSVPGLACADDRGPDPLHSLLSVHRSRLGEVLGGPGYADPDPSRTAVYSFF